MSLNLVVFSGRVGKDPELRSTTSNKSITSFSIAVDRGYGDKKKTIWVNVEAWEKTAEAISRLVKKGARITVTGELDEDSWEDKQTGKKMFKTKVVANRVDIIDFPESGESNDKEDEDIPF